MSINKLIVSSGNHCLKTMFKADMDRKFILDIKPSQNRHL